jgi:hypothetical protein
VSACAGSWVASKEVQVNIITMPVPVISTAKNEYCIGDVATLAINDLYPTYTVSWFRDGSPLPEFNNKNSIAANCRVAIQQLSTTPIYHARKRLCR